MAVETSNIRIVPNIVLKSKYDKNWSAYVPVDLLPKEYLDARVTPALTSVQRIQREKMMFLAAKVVDEDEE